MKIKILLSSIIGGVIIALLTGLIYNTLWVGAVGYGYPFAWYLRLVLPPEHVSFWHVSASNLIADIIIWAAIIGIVLLVLARTKRSGR